MRRLYAAAALAVLVAVVCWWGIRTLQRDTAQMFGILDIAQTAMTEDDVISAREEAEMLEKTWTQAESRLAVFCHHKLIEDIGVVLAGLPSLAESATRAEFLAECSRARILLLHLREDEALRWRSVL